MLVFILFEKRSAGLTHLGFTEIRKTRKKPKGIPFAGTLKIKCKDLKTKKHYKRIIKANK